MTERRIQRTDKEVYLWEKTGEKTCSHCKVFKPLQEFEKTQRKSGGNSYSSWCKRCTAQMHLDRRVKKYDLTAEEWERVLDIQNHGCAICGRAESTFTKRLSVDHDHKTGLLRGALCWHCNHLLGEANDDPEKLMLAFLYLLRPPVVSVLGYRFTLPGRIGSKRKYRERLERKLPRNKVSLIRNQETAIQIVARTLKYVLNPPARHVVQQMLAEKGLTSIENN